MNLSEHRPGNPPVIMEAIADEILSSIVPGLGYTWRFEEAYSSYKDPYLGLDLHFPSKEVALTIGYNFLGSGDIELTIRSTKLKFDPISTGLQGLEQAITELREVLTMDPETQDGPHP